jgi:hypothetical protein
MSTFLKKLFISHSVGNAANCCYCTHTTGTDNSHIMHAIHGWNFIIKIHENFFPT